MPQTVGYFLAWVTGTYVSAATAAAVTNALFAIALSYASSKLTAAQMKVNHKKTAQEVVIRDTTQPKVRVYGEAFVGGVIGYINSVHPGVDQGHELHMLIVVAGHEITDITDIYLDDRLLASGGELDWSANAVTSGPYDPDSRADCEAVKFWKYLGTSSQTAAPELTTHYAVDWTSDHRLRGLAYVVARFKLTSKSEKLWTPGPPQSIRVKVKGAKVYDPRLDSTNGGSGSHRADTASTWEWSNNPVLCAIDYMRVVMGVESTRIDWDWIRAQADVCDVLVPVPPSASPTNYEKRYTVNGSISLGESNGSNLSQILSCCLGWPSKVNGKWRVTAGGYQTPALSLTDDDVVGNVVVSTSTTWKERFNTVRGVFGADPAKKFRETEFAEVTDASYVSRDNGEVLPKSLSLPMVDSPYMAQRIAYKTLRQGNQQITLTVPVRMTGLRYAIGSGVNVTLTKLGFTNKVMRCVGWKMGTSAASPFELVLRSDDSDAWADPEIADYTTFADDGGIVFGTTDPDPPQDLTAISALEGVLLTWTLPEQPIPVTGYRLYASSSSAWSGASLIWEGMATEFLHKVTSQRWYWIRAVIGDDSGLRYPNSDTSSITAVPSASPPLPNILPSGYGDFETLPKNLITSWGSGGSASHDIVTDQAWLGTRSLKCTPPFAAFSTEIGVDFCAYSNRNNLILLPNRRFLVIASIYPTTAEVQNGDIRFSLLRAGSPSGMVSSSYKPLSGLTLNAWNREAWEIDGRSSFAHKVAQLELQFKTDSSGAAAAPIFYVDGLMLWDVTDYPHITTSNFSEFFIPPVMSSSGALGLEGGAVVMGGSNTPEATITAPPGSVFIDNSNGDQYVKESGTGNTGWTRVATQSDLDALGEAVQAKVAISDSANSSSTTQTDDAELAGFTIKAATIYVLQARLRFTTANDSSDLKYVWQFSQTPQDASGILVDDLGATWVAHTLTTERTRNSTGADDYILDITGRIRGHATLDGTMDFQWARNAASGTTTRKAGSYVILTPQG